MAGAPAAASPPLSGHNGAGALTVTRRLPSWSLQSSGAELGPRTMVCPFLPFSFFALYLSVSKRRVGLECVVQGRCASAGSGRVQVVWDRAMAFHVMHS